MRRSAINNPWDREINTGFEFLYREEVVPELRALLHSVDTSNLVNAIKAAALIEARDAILTDDRPTRTDDLYADVWDDLTNRDADLATDCTATSLTSSATA